MNFRDNKLVLLFLVGIILIIGYFVGRNDKTVAIETFQQFDSNNINGVISYVGIKYHGVCFKLKGNKKTYVFNPSFEHKLDGMHDFTSFAKPGDKVVKEERLLQDLHERIRDVRQGPDGALYLLTDNASGRVLRVSPSK